MSEIKDTTFGKIVTKEPGFSDQALDVPISINPDPGLFEIKSPERAGKSISEKISVKDAPQNSNSTFNLDQAGISQGLNLSVVMVHQNERYKNASIDSEHYVPAYQVNPFIEIRGNEVTLSYSTGEKPKMISGDYSAVSVDSPIPVSEGIKAGVQTKDQSAQIGLNTLLDEQQISTATIAFRERIELDQKNLPAGKNEIQPPSTADLKEKFDHRISEEKYKDTKGKRSLDDMLFKKKEITLEERFQPNVDSKSFIDEWVAQLARLWYQLMQWLEKLLKRLRKLLFRDALSVFHIMTGKKQKEKEQEENEEKQEIEKLRKKLEKERQSLTTGRE